MNQFSRNLLSYGREGQAILKKSAVAVLGLGGVGSFACEAIARSGVGTIILIDKDTVDVTNINRQLIATHKTVGLPKVDVMKARIADINPECTVSSHQLFFNDETADEILNLNPDFVIDASDTVTYKILLIKECLKRRIPFISVMGTANKLDPTRLQIADIKDTSVDPLAKVIRIELRKKGIFGNVPVVYSREEPLVSKYEEYDGIINDATRKGQYPPASNSFVPPAAGLISASYVIRNLLNSIEFKRKGE